MDFWRSVIDRLRKLASLSAAELVTLALTSVALRVAPALLRRKGLQGAQAMLARRTPVAPPAADQPAVVDSLARLVDIGSKFGPAKPNCLARSLVLWWLLERRGVDSEVRIGVRRSREHAGMDFHAWVERDGVVLNDAPDIRSQFATFDRAIVPRGADFD